MKEKFHCGVNIKKFRRVINMSQKSLGEKIGKTQALISYIEKTGIVNHSVLEDIAKVIGVNIEVLENDSIEIAENQFIKKINREELYRHLYEENIFLKKLVDDLKTILHNFSIKDS